MRFSIILALALLAAPAKAQTAPEADTLVTGSIGQSSFSREQPQAKDAIRMYKAGRRADGDALAAGLTDKTLRMAVEWALIRSAQTSVGTERLIRFMRSHPDFPAMAFLKQRMENALFVERAAAGPSFDFFDGRDPEMASGKLLLAMHLRDKGFPALAAAQIRQAWRERDVPADVEKVILDSFGEVLTSADHRYRALKLIHAGQTGRGIRAAQRVSADFAVLAEQLAIAARSKGSLQRLIDRVPPSMRGEPAFALLRATELRRKDRHVDAAKLLLSVTTDPELFAGGDAWWLEERALLRGLLDANEPGLAYRIAASSRAESATAKAEAHFLAGFIAARLLSMPAAADMQFLQSKAHAPDAPAKSRAAYWLGRSRDMLALPSGAFYREAAAFSATYYGQLAAAELGQPLHLPQHDASDADKAALRAMPAARAIKALLDIDERELAAPLIHALAEQLPTAGAVDALAALVDAAGEPRLSLSLGRRALARGVPVVEAAFPVDAIPAFEPVSNGPERALVFAVARQESAFDPRAVSRADARGLMQLLPSTARVTAKRFGIPFAPADLLDNPALNARLGAAHLSELMEATRGNLPLMLAAYNAGPRRMREWVAAYGDPRDPAVDPVDWVERIPFAETRFYIQKVTENLQVYRARFTPGNSRTIRDDLAFGRQLMEAALP